MKINFKIFKISLILICFLIISFSIIGCVFNKAYNTTLFIPNPNVRFTPILKGIVVNKYGLTSEIELCEIILSKTKDMQNIFNRFRLYKNNEFEVTENELKGNKEFYIGAFIDFDKNLEPSIGNEPLGGEYINHALKLCQSYEANFMENLDNKYKITIKDYEPTFVELKIIRPIVKIKPLNGDIGTTCKPEFEWNKINGLNCYKITVYNDENSKLFWQAITYSNKITYATINTNLGDYIISNAITLPANQRHKWSLLGYDNNNEIWGYGIGTTFLP